MELSSIYSPSHRTGFIALGLVLIFVIAIIDLVTPSLPLGYLYLFPILLLSGFLDRGWIALIVLICAGLTGLLSHYSFKPAIILFVMALVAFTGTGFFVSEVVSNRQKAIEHVHEMETLIRLRHETEDQLRGLVESSPLAIITIDARSEILLANDAAQSLLAPDEASIIGHPIVQFLPALHDVMRRSESRQFRTQIRCRGTRTNGELFLAEVWFSTSITAVGTTLSAIIVDFSEDLRGREDLSLEHLLKNAKILVGAIAHEIRNLCGAVLVVHKNLSRLEGMQKNEDFRALGTLVSGLGKLSEMELRPSWTQFQTVIDLPSVLDELRVVVEPTFTDAGMKISWMAPADLPLILGERYGLLQVFLNLVRNSQRAMETTNSKQLTISSDVDSGTVTIRFEDTGIGISDPSELFKPFYHNADANGLGLYVSRAILRSFHGDLRYESRSEGCCFAVRLTRFIGSGAIGG